MGRAANCAILGLALLPALYLAWQGRDVPQFGIFHDDSIYVVTAQSLAENGQYRIASLPWEPPQTKYPPLYPAWLVPAWWWGKTLEAFLPLGLALNWLWLPVFVMGVRRWVERSQLPEWMATVIPAVMALHPEVQLSATRLMSDLMFAALVVWSMAGGGVWTAVMAFGTRTAALPLLAALPVVEWMQGNRARAQRWMACFAVAAAGWFVWGGWVRYPAGSSLERYYTDYFAYQLDRVPPAEWPAHAYQQLDALANAVAHALLLHFDGGPGAAILSRLAALAAIAGIVRMVRQRQQQAYALYAMGAAGMMLIWYFPPDGRTMLPLMPLLWAGLIVEVMNLTRLLGGAWQQGGAQRGLVVVMGVGLGLVPAAMVQHGYREWQVQGPEAFSAERRSRDAVEAAYQWMARNTPSGTRFFAVDDPLLYLKTGRKALREPELDGVYAKAGNGAMRPSAETMQLMRRLHLQCFFASLRHFDPGGNGMAPPVWADDVAPMKAIYKSPSAMVVCLP